MNHSKFLENLDFGFLNLAVYSYLECMSVTKYESGRLKKFQELKPAFNTRKQ